MRVCPKGYNIDFIHVDVFWLFGAEENKKNRYEKKRKFVRNVMRYKYYKKEYLGKMSGFEKIKYFIQRFITWFIPTSYCDAFMKKIMQRKTNGHKIKKIKIEYNNNYNRSIIKIILLIKVKLINNHNNNNSHNNNHNNRHNHKHNHNNNNNNKIILIKIINNLLNHNHNHSLINHWLK